MERILDESILAQVREAFEKLKEPVQLIFFGSEPGCETCGTVRQLLEEIVSVDERLKLEVHDLQQDGGVAAKYKVTKSPALVVAARVGGQIRDLGIRFSGIPAGYEFSTLINDILLASNRDSGLSQKTREFLKNLDKPIFLQVFVTPT